MNGSVGFGMKFWPVLILSGAGMFVFAFFMPWWGVSETVPAKPKPPKVNFRNIDESREKYEKYQRERDAYDKKIGKVAKARKKSKKWFEAMEIDEKFDDLIDEKKDDAEKDESYTATWRLWGWNTGTSLAAFIFGLVILPLVIVSMFVGALKNWRWIGSYVAAIMGLIALILGMVFYFGSPSENVADGLSQGVGLSPGPYLVMLGSLCILVGGAFDGVFGTMALVGGGKNSNRAMDLDDLDELELDDD